MRKQSVPGREPGYKATVILGISTPFNILLFTSYFTYTCMHNLDLVFNGPTACWLPFSFTNATLNRGSKNKEMASNYTNVPVALRCSCSVEWSCLFWVCTCTCNLCAIRSYQYFCWSRVVHARERNCDESECSCHFGGGPLFKELKDGEISILKYCWHLLSAAY